MLSRLKDKHDWQRAALVSVAILVACTGVLLPFAVFGVFDDLLDPPTNRVYALFLSQQPAPDHLRLHIEATDIDQTAHMASLRISGHQVCLSDCRDSYRLLLVSAVTDMEHAEGLPPSTTVHIPAATKEITHTVTVPFQGDPIRYPFDSYQLTLGVVLQHVLADGRVQSLSQAEAEKRLFLTFQSQLQRVETSDPKTIDTTAIDPEESDYPFVVVKQIGFTRPMYLKVLAVLLVLLVTAAAAFAVFMRPLNDLVASVGALVLGIWGVRSILVGTNAVPGETAVDLSLGVVTIVLLMSIAIRTLLFLDQRCGFNLVGHKKVATDYHPGVPLTSHSENGTAPPPVAATSDTTGPV